MNGRAITSLPNGLAASVFILTAEDELTTGLKLQASPTASGTIILPSGTTDFTVTGGTNQVIMQPTPGGPFTVGTVGTANTPTTIVITTATVLPPGFVGVVLVNATATMSITLPSSPTLGQSITIKDSAGTANIRPITINGGGPNIEGQTMLVLDSSYNWAQLAYSGSQWVQI